jgi:hypothetical protein
MRRPQEAPRPLEKLLPKGRIIGWGAGFCRRRMLKPEPVQIQLLDAFIEKPNRILRPDLILNGFGQ